MKQGSATIPMVPENKKGKALDLEHSVIENSPEEAITTFKRACKRLLNPPTWHELSGALSATFKLGPSTGPGVERLAQINDYIRIDIPGPGAVAGDGYDWVQVQNIIENPDSSAGESFGMTLKAAVNPDKPEQGIAHFFGDGATSTFIVKRNGNNVTASYHGRNEIPNTKKVDLPDKIRNSIIAAGALAGISELQWAALIKGLLEKEIGG